MLGKLDAVSKLYEDQRNQNCDGMTHLIERFANLPPGNEKATGRYI